MIGQYKPASFILTSRICSGKCRNTCWERSDVRACVRSGAHTQRYKDFSSRQASQGSSCVSKSNRVGLMSGSWSDPTKTTHGFSTYSEQGFFGLELAFDDKLYDLPQFNYAAWCMTIFQYICMTSIVSGICFSETTKIKHASYLIVAVFTIQVVHYDLHQYFTGFSKQSGIYPVY